MSIQGITKSRLFWPLVALFLLVMVNFWFNPDFFSIRIVKGGLYGSVIDIINRAAPVMLIAMGMTLVIATRGIGISVGATVAISGAIGASTRVAARTSSSRVVERRHRSTSRATSAPTRSERVEVGAWALARRFGAAFASMGASVSPRGEGRQGRAGATTDQEPLRPR